jgi:hypothetical protein
MVPATVTPAAAIMELVATIRYAMAMAPVPEIQIVHRILSLKTTNMKYSKLKTLLLNVDGSTSEEDILVNLNEEVALKLRGGVVSSNGTCTSNTGCTNNDTCQGQNGCSGNGVCNKGCDD